MNEAIRMQVSAFVDGELPENEADLLVRRLSQNAVLRQQVAEYLAIGRIMRGDYSAHGSEVLRRRIAAELDERPLQDDASEVVPERSTRYVRPLAGFAIAATVALVAIVGLRQTVGIDMPPAAETFAADEPASVTVPTMSEELRQYYLIHGENHNAFTVRRAAAEIRVHELVEEEAVAGDSDAVDAPDEDGAGTSQP